MIKSVVAMIFVYLVAVFSIGLTPRTCGAQQAAEIRDWRDVGGRRITASLFSSNGTTVTLQKENGDKVGISITRLSASDQDYIRRNDGPAKVEAGIASELEAKCGELCEQISKSYRARRSTEKPTIAVVEFSDLEGNITNLGRLLSEELITRMFATGNYKVIERLLLNKAIAEHKLQLQGLVDPKSAKELGKILGVDAIVSGTIAEVGNAMRINSRLISTETGEVLSVAAATLRKDKLPDIGGGGGTRNSNRASGVKIMLPYREDFSDYKEGDLTDWGAAAKVATGRDGRMWLAPAQKGQKPIGIDVNLPDNAYIEFEYSVDTLESGRAMTNTLSGITFIDEDGAKYRIEWILEGTKYGNVNYSLKLPGGASQGDSTNDSRYNAGTIRLRKAGSTLSVEREGDRALSADVSDFKNFTRCEVDMYKGPNSTIWFTNFKIGSTVPQRKGGTSPKSPIKPR